ncbi:MAG TPA: DUF2382 domain-containing protein [Pantanalinema sp.]
MLRRLQDLPDYHVAEGEPDIRGWAVSDRLGKKVGEIDSLLVDTEHDHEDSRGYLPIRYMGLKVENQIRLVPIGLIDIDETKKAATFREAGAQDTTRFAVYDESGTMTKGAQAYSTLFKEPGIDYGRAEFKHESERLNLIEERLKVGKRSTQVGEVIARKRVEEVPVEETVSLRKEHVEIERHPVNKPLTEGKFGEGDKEIRMSIMAEEAVVEKVPYVKEEIILRKEVETENKVIHDKVREEELEFSGTEPERHEKTLSEKMRNRIDELKKE